MENLIFVGIISKIVLRSIKFLEIFNVFEYEKCCYQLLFHDKV